MVVILKNQTEFDAFIKEGVAVIDCFAEWCGPCKMIAPKYEELSKKMTNVKFGKIDVDVAEDVAAALGVQAMPSFFFFKNGAPAGKPVVGADLNAVIKHLESLA